MKKITALALVALLSLGALCVLAGCAANHEQVIRDATEKELAVMKDPSSQDYKDLVSTMSMLSTYRIDAEEFVASWMSGYDYSVGQVTVTGNTATVEVTITIKQMGPIMDEWFAEISTLTQREDLTEDFDVYGEAGKSLTALMAAAKPTSTTILLDCTLQGDTWIIAQDDTELMKALMGESTFLNL